MGVIIFLLFLKFFVNQAKLPVMNQIADQGSSIVR